MISDKLYSELEKMKWNGGVYGVSPKGPANNAVWSHLQDAVDIGSISPMDAYDALKLGYLPEHLTVRKSRYAHLL